MNTVTLSGSAHYIGRKVGMLSREPMRRRLIAQLGGEEAWPDLLALHADRCHAYRDLLLSFAPSWLDEAEGMAEGAGVPVEALLLINSASAELKPPAPDNCTAYMALGSASGSGANLFHKNRDNRPDTQLFFARHIEGHYRTLGDHAKEDLRRCAAPLRGDGRGGSGARRCRPLRHDLPLRRPVAGSGR